MFDDVLGTYNDERGVGFGSHANAPSAATFIFWHNIPFGNKISIITPLPFTSRPISGIIVMFVGAYAELLSLRHEAASVYLLPDVGVNVSDAASVPQFPLV